MTEKEIRSTFLERYTGNNLDETIMMSLEEIILTLLKEHAEDTETLPDIFRTIAQSKSRIYFFMDMFASGRVEPLVLTHYLSYFDNIRRTMLDVVNYMYDNYKVVQPWFKERFSREGLKKTKNEMAETIEKQAGMPRVINFNELSHNDGFFNTAILGILGMECFHNYSEEYIKCLKVFRQCQAACNSLEAIPADTKGS